MREKLILPMMMFGKFRATRAKRDEHGNTIVKGRDKQGRKIYEKEKVWIMHVEKDGDQGVYPSVNHIYTRMTGGRQKLKAPAMRLQEKWQAQASVWADMNDWTMSKGEKVVIELTAHFPADKIRRDVNNIFKLLMDAFTGVIYDDDEYALPRVMDFDKVESGEQAYIEIDIYLKSEEKDSSID